MPAVMLTQFQFNIPGYSNFFPLPSPNSNTTKTVKKDLMKLWLFKLPIFFCWWCLKLFRCNKISGKDFTARGYYLSYWDIITKYNIAVNPSLQIVNAFYISFSFLPFLFSYLIAFIFQFLFIIAWWISAKFYYHFLPPHWQRHVKVELSDKDFHFSHCIFLCWKEILV